MRESREIGGKIRGSLGLGSFSLSYYFSNAALTFIFLENFGWRGLDGIIDW